MTAHRNTRSLLFPVGLGVAVGLVTIFSVGVYSMYASTQPERGWIPFDGRVLVLSGCLSGALAGWIASWRIARLRPAKGISRE
jgi:ABC-type antimicrobial peptide transport system permease subunit